MNLTQKDVLELKFWLQASEAELEGERRKIAKYHSLFDFADRYKDGTFLEVGTGPEWGLLPGVQAAKKVGVDPLYPAYEAAGILRERNGVLRYDESFETWACDDESFDAIATTNALDHGEMGFYVIPKLWRLLKTGGLLYVHVHLRPPELLNLVHDHRLTEEQLDKNLAYTNLVQVSRTVFPTDVDGKFCPALVGIWRKP